MVISQNMKVKPVRSDRSNPLQNPGRTRYKLKKKKSRLILLAISNFFIFPVLVYSHNTKFEFIMKKKKQTSKLKS